MTLINYNVIIGGESIKSVTIRFSDVLHKKMKFKLLEEEKSVQQYLIELIKKDLNFSDNEDDLDDYLPKK